MYKEVLSEIENIGMYPLFSFVMFFAFFMLVTFWVIRTKKNDFELISKIPLTEEEKREEYDNKI